MHIESHQQQLLHLGAVQIQAQKQAGWIPLAGHQAGLHVHCWHHLVASPHAQQPAPWQLRLELWREQGNGVEAPPLMQLCTKAVVALLCAQVQCIGVAVVQSSAQSTVSLEVPCAPRRLPHFH